MNKRSCTVLLLLIFLSAAGQAQAPAPAVFGQIFIYNPAGKTPRPGPGYRVTLYHPARGWTSPSLTDGQGGYAIFNVPPDVYLMHVYSIDNRLVWRQQLRAPARPLPAIVLPRP